MSFASREASVDQAAIVKLFHFVQGTNEWNYTSAEVPIVYGGDTYSILEISHGEIPDSNRDSEGKVEISVPTNSPIGLLFKDDTPEKIVDVTIISVMREEPNAIKFDFLGEVENGVFEGPNGKLICASFLAQLATPIPRGTMQRNQCIWFLGEADTCNLNLSYFTHTGVVSGLSPNGLIVTVTGTAAFVPTLPGGVARVDQFAKGVIVKGNRRGMIESQNGDQIYLMERLPTLALADQVSLIAGDPLTPEVCRDYFMNIARYMAHPGIPPVSPWYGQGLGA